MSVSMPQIILILVVVVLLFGAKRIPELARALGKASAEFKKAKDGIDKETNELMDSTEKQAELKDKKQNVSENKQG